MLFRVKAEETSRSMMRVCFVNAWKEEGGYIAVQMFNLHFNKTIK
jgi:hypothetical protein